MKILIIKKIKKVFATVMILVIFLSGANSLHAISAADIEFLISIGLISAENADLARQAVGAVNSQDVGSAVKSDLNSDFECLILNQNLVKGNKGSVVASLQKFLQQLGHFPKTESLSGYYGDTTLKAVSDFQLAKGLIKSSGQIGAGAVGPITRSKIQEVSCNQAASAIAAAAPAPAVSQPVSTPATVSSTVKNKILTKSELKLKTSTIYEDQQSGTVHFKYDMSVMPKNDIAYYNLTLVCSPGTLKTNRSDLTQCGQTIKLTASNQGKKSIKIGFTNLTNAFQTIGVFIEAFDSSDNLLDSGESINELSAAKPVSYIDQILDDGTKSKVGVFSNRICDRREQLDFIKYTMSVSQTPENKLVPPTCWPGDILCDFAVNFPPTYCQIPNGPTSNDLCPTNQRFYDGKCISKA